MPKITPFSSLPKHLALLLDLGDSDQEIPRLLHVRLQVLKVGKTLAARRLHLVLVAGAAKLLREKVRRDVVDQVVGVVPVEGDRLDDLVVEERLQQGEELVEHPGVVDKVDCSEGEGKTSGKKVAEAAKLFNSESSEVSEAEVGEIDHDDDSSDLSSWLHRYQLEERELEGVEALNGDLRRLPGTESEEDNPAAMLVSSRSRPHQAGGRRLTTLVQREEEAGEVSNKLD